MSEASAAQTLLEREGELASLEAALESAAEGNGSVLLIEGPAGIGKSELLAAAEARAGDRGMEVLTARGGELEQSFGFGVARQLFEARLGEASAAQRRRLLNGPAKLAARTVLLDEQDGGSEPAVPVGDPAAPVQHGLHWLLANLAETNPVLVAIDDLQWADPGSIRWLVYLARRVSDIPVLLVATVRTGDPGLDEGLLAAIEGEAATQVLHPAVLSELGSAELVRLEFGDGAEDGFCAACHRATGGNPFLLRELIAAARDDDLPPTTASIERIEDLRPETITRSLLLRLANLPPGAEPLTRAVAILGERAELRHAASLAELDAEEAAAVADALAAAAILAPGHPLRFAHPLIRAAVYAEIPAAQRALAHSRAAHLLQEDGAAPEQVAAQLLHSGAGTSPGGLTILRRAAANAVARAAPDAAVAYLKRAVMEPDAAEVRPMLVAELLAAGTRAGDLSALDGISDDPVAELIADEEAFQAAGPNLVVWAFLNGQIAAMTDVIERGIAIYRRDGDEAMALRQESLALSVIDITPSAAVARLESYADRLEPGTQEERAWFAMRGWWQHFVGGPASESVGLVRRGLDQGQLLDVENLGPAFSQAVLVLLRADDLDEAERWIGLLAEDARQREPAYAVSTAGLRSWLAYRRGDLRAAEVDARLAVDICRDQRVALALAVNLRWLLDVLIDTGRLEDAEAELRLSGLDGTLPDFWWFVPLRMARARLRIALGRTEDGIDDLRELLRQHDSTRPASEPIASTLALALDSLEQDPDEVRRLLDWELRSAREWGTPRGIGVALRAQALVERGERGTELLGESAETLRASPARLELARSLTEFGSALRRANRRVDAREPLREALEIAHRWGAAPIAERAREELAASGAKPRRVRLSGVESLTPSELRVAKLAADGMSNREIAHDLFVSVKTIETHLGSVYRKLDISSRRELPAALADEPQDLSG
jgi:DNA-binding CsgD family transcriptional regulator